MENVHGAGLQGQTKRKQERNKKRRENIRRKRKERIKKINQTLQELDDTTRELSQTRCKLIETRKRAAVLNKKSCVPPKRCFVSPHSFQSVSSSRCQLRSRPTPSSGLRSCSTSRASHTYTPEVLQQQIKKLDKGSLMACGSCSCELGSGTFGKCTKMIFCSTEVAVKTTTLPSYSHKDIMFEALVMKDVCCGHPNLPLFIGVCDQLDGRSKPLLVSRFYSVAGEPRTLHQHLVKQSKLQTTGAVNDMARILLGVCNGIEAIHQKGYLHNDLKCDNVVLSDCVPYMEKAPTVWPVIIDFGKAKPLSSPKSYKLNKTEIEQYLRRYTHLAPELIKGLHPQSVLTDVYSLGHVVKKVATVLSSQELRRIAKSCTSPDQGNRPTVLFISELISSLT